MISNSFDQASPSTNQNSKRGRMAFANAEANDSNSEVTIHQPLDQVTRVEWDDSLLTVDGQDRGTTVVRLLSEGRRGNKENVQPASTRATRSTHPPV